MFDEREEWREARDGLVSEVTRLGFDEALGKEIAKNLGSPKAMDRMAAYLRYEKPKKVEIVVAMAETATIQEMIVGSLAILA